MSVFSDWVQKIKDWFAKQQKPESTPAPVPPTPTPPVPDPVPVTTMIDACLFYKAKTGDYGQNRGYTSTLSVCGWSFNHQGDDAKTESQLQRLCMESKDFGQKNKLNVRLVPMIMISSNGKWTPYNSYPYGGGLHKERVCFWLGIWRQKFMTGCGLYPFPIFSCGDSLDSTNNPNYENWQKMVREVGAYVQGDEWGAKFSREFPDICAIWEAEKLGGVSTAQKAVDVCRAAFPKSRIWIHATKPEFAGVNADVVAIQSPLDPFRGDELTDQVIKNHYESFRKAKKLASTKLHWMEWAMPDLKRVNDQRGLMRNLPDCCGTGC